MQLHTMRPIEYGWFFARYSLFPPEPRLFDYGDCGYTVNHVFAHVLITEIPQLIYLSICLYHILNQLVSIPITFFHARVYRIGPMLIRNTAKETSHV